MPKALSPIPLGTPIVDRAGAINIFFRQQWEALRNSFQVSPTVASVQRLDQSAAIVTESAYLTKAAGLYRISYYVRKTVADGVSSSLTVTLGWSDGVAVTEAGAALATDSILAEQSGSKVVYAAANTDLTFAVTYASNTPGTMHYRIHVVIEQLA